LISCNHSVDFFLSSFEQMEGGEIFIPKIPSMKITDLAKSLSPNLSTHVVGIRPGEKLHEVMITEDDARTTIDAGDRYIIQPAFKNWAAGENAWPDTKPVPENFQYASDSNSDWLSLDDLKMMIEAGKK